MEKLETTLTNKHSKSVDKALKKIVIEEENKQKIKDAINYIDIYIKEVERIRMYLNGTKRKMQEVIKDTPEDRWPKRK